MKPTRLTRGAISLSISSHFPPISASKIANPVMLLPGRAKLATKPLPTGSPTSTKRIGIVEVSFCRIAVTKLEVGTIRSGEALTSSLAKVRTLSGIPPVHRMSIRILRPFVHPSSWSPSWNAATLASPSTSPSGKPSSRGTLFGPPMKGGSRGVPPLTHAL